MFYVNKAILVGNIAALYDKRILPSGKSVISFTVATNRSVKKNDNEWNNIPSFHRVSAFGFNADNVAKCLKGEKVYVEGRIDYSEYQDKSGATVKQTQIVADTIITLAGKKGSTQSPTGDLEDSSQVSQEPRVPEDEIQLADIPF